MNINVLQSNNPYLNKIDNINRSKLLKINKHTQLADHLAKNNISNTEKKYFQKLFPENANQIENYLTFNRNGNINKINTEKGNIFDKKI